MAWGISHSRFEEASPSKSVRLVWTLSWGLMVAAMPATFAADTSSPNATRVAAQTLESKLQILSETAPERSRSFPSIVVTEEEANAYLKYHARDFLPAGVKEPAIHIMPDHVLGSANVDFGEFSRAYPNPSDWGPKVLAAMFKGPQHVTAAGKLESQNGHYQVKIETVAIGATKIPDWLVEFLLQNYVQPRYKIDLSKPLTLPDHVTRIQLGSGRATFIRSAQKGR